MQKINDNKENNFNNDEYNDDNNDNFFNVDEIIDNSSMKFIEKKDHQAIIYLKKIIFILLEI